MSFVKGIRGWEAGSRALYLGVLVAGLSQTLVIRLSCVGHDAPSLWGALSAGLQPCKARQPCPQALTKEAWPDVSEPCFLGGVHWAWSRRSSFKGATDQNETHPGRSRLGTRGRRCDPKPQRQVLPTLGGSVTRRGGGERQSSSHKTIPRR